MILRGDCLEKLGGLSDESVQTCVTSPPYWGLRDYGVDGQLGLEKTPAEYVENMVRVFREVRRVLKKEGTLWLNLGDSYAATTKGSGGTASGTIAGGKGQATNAGAFYDAKFDLRACGLKPKDLVGIPWRVAFALQADGWYLRQDIIWHKPNPMPESVRDRCTKSHEYIFLLSKSPRYYFDSDAILEPFVSEREGKTGKRNGTPFTAAKNDRTNSGGFSRSRHGRNKRSVWTVTTKAYKGAHFATFPTDLIEPCILAGSASGDFVLDPFAGAGTTGVVAKKHGREFLGIELNDEYADIAEKRIGAA